MIGLLSLVAFMVYLAVTCAVVWLVIHWARRTGRGVKRWAAAAVLAMNLLVFWDHLPTLALYKYYCATKAEFWVYKTPEQWKTENPGVAETLMWRENSPIYEVSGVPQGYRLNERFVSINQVSRAPILPVRITHESIVDIKTSETMIKRIRVGAGYSGGKVFISFWTDMEPYIPYSNEFYTLEKSFKQLGREVKPGRIKSL